MNTYFKQGLLLFLFIFLSLGGYAYAQGEDLRLRQMGRELEICRLRLENALLAEKLNTYEILTARRHNFSQQITAKDDIYRALGYLYLIDQEWDMAIHFYKEVFELNPQDRDAHYNLGYLYVQKGKYKEAVKHYKNALGSDTLDNDIYYNLAVIFSKYLKDEEQANIYYAKISE